MATERKTKPSDKTTTDEPAVLPPQEKTPQEKPAKKPSDPATYVVKDSQRVMKEIDIRLITSSLGDNHRYPFTKAMMNAGYGMFGPLPGKSEDLVLWPLATSDDPAQRAEFLRVMEMYEGENPADPTIIDLAVSIHAGLKGQMYQVFVRDNGKKGGKHTFTLVAGHRRVMAILYLWCKGLRKGAPMVTAELVKGNGLELRALQKDENAQRKAVSPITVAEGYRRSMNEGVPLDKVAKANGVSEQTVERWLKFLELEPGEQERLENGKLRHDDAIAIVDDRRKGGVGLTPDGLNAVQAATARPAKGGTRKKNPLSPKRLASIYENPPNDWCVPPDTIRKVLGVLLGKIDKTGKAVSATDQAAAAEDSEQAVLPPEGVGFGLVDDGQLEIDASGNIVVRK